MSRVLPGPRNLITDVAGLRVGNAEDRAARSGVTVVLPDARTVAAVDVRGGGPGTRDTELLDPTCLVDAVDAIVLSGGSVYGLEAAAGVTCWLADAGRGFPLGPLRVPICPSAILFDLLNGGDKGWGARPPYRDLGLAACAAATLEVPLGNVGAGLGAKAGVLKGGLGSASAVDGASGLTVGALIAANPVGSAVMPGQPTLWAWALEQRGELGGQPPPLRGSDLEAEFPALPATAEPGGNTTIGVVATDAVLTKAEAKRLAMMAQDGLARAVRPSHTPFDGDTLFVLATGARPLPEPRALALARLGAIAADTAARALARGVYEAESLGPFPGYRATHGGALTGRR